MIATASLIMPSPKRIEFKMGYFYGLISEIAATVSVAQRTLLIINVYFNVRVSKNISSRTDNTSDRHTNPNIVPNTPKKLINPIFWKNNDFLRLYPAANIIGGRMIEKKISLLNSI